MLSQRRWAARTSRPVSARSSGVDGVTPERGSTGAQMSRPITSAPSWAKAIAVARPIPRAAPVTAATLPRRDSFDPGIVWLPLSPPRPNWLGCLTVSFLALALAGRRAFGGGLLQFPALALGRHPFGG